ncbi:hypothetical protein [Streptomyces sp. NPDC000410]|uniref:hypothetical protein n=1 Tax=Streptomyces sp. NPDC000410 TaxID=3154254 RepID=UPI003316FAA9
MTGTAERTAADRPTRFDRRMYEVMNRREAAALHATAGRRRAFVAAHIVLTAAAVAAWLGTVLGDQLWWLFVMLGTIPPWVFVMGVLNGATRGLLELRTRILDERQIAERAAVLARAHKLTTWLFFGATAGAGAAAWFGDMNGEVMLFSVLFVVLVVHWLMPAWVAGLRVQDEVEDDLGME